MADKSGKCENCGKISESRCGSCRAVFYCSLEHQKKDWKRHKPNCSKKKYDFGQNDTLGHYMIASEDLKPDTLIFKDKPLILGPKQGVSEIDDNKTAFCIVCCKTTVEPTIRLYPCPTCSLPVCSTECSDQFFHKNYECRFIREVQQQQKKGNSSSENVLNVSPVSEKIAQSLMYFRCALLKSFDEKHFDQLLQMESNEKYREDLSSLEKTARVFRDLVSVFSHLEHDTVTNISKPDLHKIIGIIDTNCVHIKVSATSEMVGIYPVFSRMEHSCYPNTRYYFTPCPEKKSMYELSCRSSVKVKNGQHLSVTYTNILWNTEKRRDFLKKQKFFWCTCERCCDPLELGSNFSTLICPVQDCDNMCTPVLQPGTTDANIYWQCQNKSKKCGKICESWQVKKVDTKLSEVVKTVLPTVKNYKELVSKIEELVHPDYYLNFVVNHSLIQMLGQDEATRNDPNVLDEKLKLCTRLISLIKKLDPGLAVLNVYAAVVFYEMHSAILAMVGGEVDDDYLILKKNPESVKLSKVYLQKCIDCFKYELLDLPETKMKVLANKKLQYLNMIVKYANM